MKKLNTLLILLVALLIVSCSTTSKNNPATKENIVIVATFTTTPDKAGELEKILSSLIEDTHSEEGCIMYNFHKNRNKEGEFTFFEIFKDQEAFDIHFNKGYIKDALKKLEPILISEPDVKFLQKVM